MEDRVKLVILGISYSPLQSGAFALLLAEEDGPYRMPIVVGASEAQSIAIKIEGIITPRPLTHELFVSFSHAFGVALEEVFIYKFEDGIFSSEMYFTDGEREVRLDARTSDAIAIAIRTGAPIYTTREILATAGTIWESSDKESRKNEIKASVDYSENATDSDDKDYFSMNNDELQNLLQKLIEDEDYEEAAKVSEILKERNNGQNS